MASKHSKSAAGQIFLFEFLNVSEPESDLTADSEMTDSMNMISEDSFERRFRDFPAESEVFYCQDWTGDLWFALDARGRVWSIH
jgi:hypothetical protein